ncbi:MAG TPA: PHP domain-containing protein [bacterium]
MAAPGFAIDLHVHTHLSGDNAADPEECVARAIERGLQGIAFTEHYSYGVSEPIEGLRERYRAALLVVRGVEFSTAEGHCLVFGVDTDRLCAPYAPAAELVRLVGERGGAVIPSHPYRGGGTGLGDCILALRGITAVEGHNGCNAGGLNRRAIEAARRLGLPVTGGSDAHRPEDVGDCFTRFRRRVTADNLVVLLRGGEYEAVDTRRASAGLFR